MRDDLHAGSRGIIEAYRSELFLGLTPYETMGKEIVPHFPWLSVKRIAQRLQRVELLITQEHVDA